MINRIKEEIAEIENCEKLLNNLQLNMYAGNEDLDHTKQKLCLKLKIKELKQELKKEIDELEFYNKIVEELINE